MSLYCVLGLYALLLIVLAVHFVRYMGYAIDAVRYPFELDYGEGIVWQQALLIPGARMYGDITHYPFIVFHYPPLYHLLVRGVASLGPDMLATGRSISLASTLIGSVLVGAVSYGVVLRSAGRSAALVGAAVAGMTVFCYWPVVSWSPLMRVDMLAIALSFAGVWLAGQPRRLTVAVLCFVLAVYTKQTCIAAPLSVLIVMLPSDPVRTLRAFGIGGAVGLSVLLALELITGGGLLRHLVLYNLNRFSLDASVTAVLEEWPQGLFLGLAIAGLLVGWRNMRLATLHSGQRLVRVWRNDAAARQITVVTAYLVFSTATLASLGKSGASLNYLIECMMIWSVLIGILVATLLGPVIAAMAISHLSGGIEVRTPAAAWVAGLLLLAQIMVMPAAHVIEGADTARATELRTLIEEVRDAHGPVLSDDMVLLLRAGKSVPWEPSIFTELASTGRWDEQLVIDMIRRRTFTLVITRGTPGTAPYDDRYTPAVDLAIRDAYPSTEILAGRTLHKPPQ